MTGGESLWRGKGKFLDMRKTGQESIGLEGGALLAMLPVCRGKAGGICQLFTPGGKEF